MLDRLFATFAGAPSDEVDLRDGRSRVPSRWRERFEGFAEADRSRPVAGGVVFVGSSSIDFWTDVEAQFPSHAVVRRGLAGATMADCAAHVDRLVLPSRPRTVVVYAGDNDLAAGATPERVVADFVALVDQVHAALPTARIVFVSIKPSPLRAVLVPKIRRTNALVRAAVAADARLDYVDVFSSMLDADGRPRAALFGADGLHMTADGYALWRDAIAAHLD